MGVSPKDAYMAADKSCANLLVQRSAPEYFIDAPIVFDGEICIMEYVTYVQAVVAMLSCLDCPTCEHGVDDAFFVEFVSTRTQEFIRFVVRFPIVGPAELKGKKYGFGDKTFSDLAEFAYYGPKWEVHTNFPNGDFSSFRSVDSVFVG